MAIALDAHTAAGVSADANPIASPQTFSHATGSGSNRLLVVTVQMRGGTGGVVSGVTYNGVAMTQVTTEMLSNSVHTSMWYLANPASGSNTVSIAHNLTGLARMVASATTLTGVDQTTPLNTSNKAGGSSAGPMTTSVTTTVADCWVIDSCSMRIGASETATMTAVTNRVLRTDAVVSATSLRGLSSSIGPAAAAGSHTTEWTKTFNHDWAIMAAAFAPVAYTLTAASGSYALTGTAATLKVGRYIAAVSGSYALTGAAASLLAARMLTATGGSYSLTGTAATLTYTPLNHYGMAAAAGSYALTGGAATLTTSQFEVWFVRHAQPDAVEALAYAGAVPPPGAFVRHPDPLEIEFA